MIGKKSCIVALIALSLGRLSCQNVGKPISESEVVTATTMSALVNLASVGECFLSKEAYFPYLFLGNGIAAEHPLPWSTGAEETSGITASNSVSTGLYLAEGARPRERRRQSRPVQLRAQVLDVRYLRGLHRPALSDRKSEL